MFVSIVLSSIPFKGYHPFVYSLLMINTSYCEKWLEKELKYCTIIKYDDFTSHKTLANTYQSNIKNFQNKFRETHSNLIFEKIV